MECWAEGICGAHPSCREHTMNPQTLTSLWMKDTVVVTI